jgi:quercetin dioxygenase-like cupin family protein
MNLTQTSFGFMHTEIDREGNILWERLIFEREGRGHTHKLWENCWVNEGSGWIVIGEEKVAVHKGQWCHIPPEHNHWMIPNECPFELVLSYTEKPSSEKADNAPYL